MKLDKVISITDDIEISLHQKGEMIYLVIYPNKDAQGYLELFVIIVDNKYETSDNIKINLDLHDKGQNIVFLLRHLALRETTKERELKIKFSVSYSNQTKLIEDNLISNLEIA